MRTAKLGSGKALEREDAVSVISGEKQGVCPTD